MGERRASAVLFMSVIGLLPSTPLALSSSARPANRREPRRAENWPQFLGPGRDGRTADGTLVEGWLRHGLRDRWRRPVGEGFSGLVVAGDRLFSMDADGRDEHVWACRADDGAPLWKVRTGRSPREYYGGLGPRTTPTLEGERLFVVSAEGTLSAHDAGSGRVLWSRSLAVDFGARPPAEGSASSPLVAAGRVFVMMGGRAGAAVGAFDAVTGRTLWTSQDDRASYSSPMLWPRPSGGQLLFLMARRLIAVDPTDGRLLWSYPWETHDGVNVATPIPAGPDRVFISAGYDQGAAVLRLDAAGPAQELWRSRVLRNHFNNSVHHDGTLYGFDEAILKAVDASSGRLLWRERGFGKGSLVAAADHLIVLSEEGEAALLEATRASAVTKARHPALAARSWTPPTPARGRLYVRSSAEIACLEPALP
jgi:outer membrane protein assembly factor BamB